MSELEEIQNDLLRGWRTVTFDATLTPMEKLEAIRSLKATFLARGLVGWLRPLIEARKATAELAAQPAPEGAIWHRGVWPERDLRDANGAAVVYDEGSPSEEEFKHIALNDPRDVIARCDAELALLDEHPVRVGYSESLCETCSERDYGGDPYPCRTVRLLGSAYRHFDGYKENWS